MMKKIISKLKVVKKQSQWIALGLCILFLMSAFYWYEWHPATIRERCSLEARGFAGEVSSSGDKFMKSWDFYYSLCIKGAGLEK
jgi:hypothetical protein